MVSTMRGYLGGGDIATKTDIHNLEVKMNELKLRLTLRLGGLMIAVGGLVVALVKLLP